MRPNRTDIGTYSGGYFNALEPDPDDIHIEDIAHALALTCRWGGHCKQFYSVAQHSVYVADYLPDALKLQGLLHDAAEAYIGDVPRPIKHQMPQFIEIEDNILRVIWDKFHLNGYDMHPDVHGVDNMMLNWEASNLLEESHWANNPFPNRPLNCMSPEDAEALFLIKFAEIAHDSPYRRRHTAI